MATLTCLHCNNEIKIQAEIGFADEEGEFETVCDDCGATVIFNVSFSVSYHATMFYYES